MPGSSVSIWLEHSGIGGQPMSTLSNPCPSALGVARSTINLWESEARLPNLENLTALMGVFPCHFLCSNPSAPHTGNHDRQTPC